ncbi:hypothetical protein ACHAWX_002587, partial [Stephanocyclus meneghinianus]
HRLGLVQGRFLRIGPPKNDNDNDNVTNKPTKRQLSIVADERTTHRRSLDVHADASARQHLSIDRSYHSTPNPQILPLLAAGIVGITAVYGYRALRQMDADWDDYYERLQDFEAAERTGSNASDVVASHFTGGTLAVDSGSSFLKVAHRNARGGTRPEVVVDGEGQRSIPAFVWMSSRDGEVAELLVGRMAAARRYDSRGGTVSSTRDALWRHSDDKDLERGVRRSIRTAASDALERVLGGDTNRSSDSASAPLFVLDPSVAVHGAYNVRPVFTYPPGSSNNQNDNHFSLQRYMNVVQYFVSPKDMALFVPEPVAALIGAEYYNLLPPANDDNNNKPVLVVDVGGTTTYVSIVSSEQRRHPNVLYSSSMPWGGDTFVDLLTRHLIHSFYGPDHDSTHRIHDDDDNNNDSTSAPSSRPTLNDPAALQRLHDASAAALQELTQKTRCRINIPYLSIDMQTKRPKHLELDVARTVLDAHAESFLRNELVSHLLQTSKQSTHTVLSNQLPPPADLSSLFASALASAMERSSLAPPSLRAVLLVGGGSRIPLVRRAVRRAAENLGGDAFLERLVVPEGEMGAELTVLGAALWEGGGTAMERR